MQELQNWFRIFCTSNGLQFTLWPSQPVAEPVRGLRGQSCELKTVRGTKNPKPNLKFLHNRYSFLRVSPESEIQCPPLVTTVFTLNVLLSTVIVVSSFKQQICRFHCFRFPYGFLLFRVLRVFSPLSRRQKKCYQGVRSL